MGGRRKVEERGQLIGSCTSAATGSYKEDNSSKRKCHVTVTAGLELMVTVAVLVMMMVACDGDGDDGDDDDDGRV